MVVGGLLVIAAVVGGILWMMLGIGDDTGLPTTTVLPDEIATANTVAGGATAVTDPAAVAVPVPIEISGVAAWDPDGTNGSENDAQAPLALADGSGATSWSTECYSSQYMGGKSGVGLIVTLSAASSGVLRVESVNAPYALRGLRIDRRHTARRSRRVGASRSPTRRSPTSPAVIETTVSTPASHLLIWLTELGPDNGCSTANPYRGRLAEITFTA